MEADEQIVSLDLDRETINTLKQVSEATGISVNELAVRSVRELHELIREFQSDLEEL